MLSSSSLLLLRPTAPILVSCRRFATQGSPQYNEPTGWLFGEKPLPPGQRRKWESWEHIWVYGMFGAMAFTTLGLYYKPDTSIQSWALKEAKSRMEARGEKYKYEPSS